MDGLERIKLAIKLWIVVIVLAILATLALKAGGVSTTADCELCQPTQAQQFGSH